MYPIMVQGLRLDFGTTPELMELPVAQAFVQFLIQKETDGFGPCAMKVLDICLGDFGAPTKKPVRLYSSNTIELVPTGGSAIGREQHHPPVCRMCPSKQMELRKGCARKPMCKVLRR